MSIEKKYQSRRKRRYIWGVLLCVPLLIAGLYATLVNIDLLFRYDDHFFTPEYSERYASPGPVALAVEKAIQTGDDVLFQELTGLRRRITLQANPDVVFTILLDVDDQGYFHYLYLDMETYRRSTYYIKQVGERYVVVPEDFYFYWDSGSWWEVYLPLALTWWVGVIVVWLALYVYRVGVRLRRSMFGAN